MPERILRLPSSVTDTDPSIAAMKASLASTRPSRRSTIISSSELVGWTSKRAGPEASGCPAGSSAACTAGGASGAASDAGP
ncbi:MAG: hypothetical protein AO395_00270 [Candidatus Fermentibacter daniensis]|nr:MAG: hypothetical protein AO395_00270 [Candidatus Fermentibacter daniensis]